MSSTVREFTRQVYRLITPSNPTIPLHGDDEKMAIKIMNQLLQSYAATGLMLTIAKTLSVPIHQGIKEIWFTDANYPENETDVAYIKEGRLANLDSAWLLLNGVTYPLIDKSRNEYLAAFKYEPLVGLPRFIITFPDTKIVKARLYPAPSQPYDFFCRGKFQKVSLDANDTLDGLPEYFELFFLYAVAKYLSKFKGRAGAWTPELEEEYRELKATMQAASEVNVAITGDNAALLNGAWRVMSGI